MAYSLTRGLAPNCDFLGIASEEMDLCDDRTFREHMIMTQKYARISVSTGKQLVGRLVPRADMNACFA